MKKWLIRILITILTLLGICSTWGYVQLQKYASGYDTEQVLSSLSADVDIYYDDYAIPHIYADTDADAYTALGYVHASERLWQMDIVRRIAPGRLSELFGADALETDRFFRTIGLAHQSEIEAQAFLKRNEEPISTKVKAYINGINQYIEQRGGALEHKIIGVSMEPYTLTDIYNVLGYMSFSFSVAHKTEASADFIYRNLEESYHDVLDWEVSSETEIIQSDPPGDIGNLSQHIHDIIGDLPAPELIGSNSWVVAPSKSKDGNVIFANDPHIGYSQPCVWYEAHIVTPTTDVYGYYLAGNPMAQIGHTRHHAIGLTMFENDDLDYYRLNTNDKNEYLYNDQWHPLKTRTEKIHIKGQKEPIPITIRESHHGPIISDVVDEIASDDVVSMWWIYQKHPLLGLEAIHDILIATDVHDVAKAVESIHAPGLNVMYGDVEGNIAWWAAAKLPIRPDHVNPKVILDGTSDRDEIVGYHPFSANPQVINPIKGYVYSANNQSESAEGLRPAGYYLPEDRAQRIVHLLEERDDWDTEGVKEMITDVTSDNAPLLLAHLLPMLPSETDEDRELHNILSKWDGAYSTDAIAPTLHTKLIHTIMRSTMQDELGPRWDVFKTSHLYRRSIPLVIADDDTPWWDDTTTETTENRQSIIELAWIRTKAELKSQLGEDYTSWHWGKVHQLTHRHVFDSNPTLRGYFNVGPYELSGSNEVINNYMFPVTDDGDYQVSGGPSTRRVINMGNLDNDSWSILPTGQSGNAQSPHYRDQADMYAAGKFRKQMMSQQEIINMHRYHSILKAKK